MNKNILKLLLSAAFVMCCTFSALAQLGVPPDNEIWYTTANGQVCAPYSYIGLADIISNNYANGHGTIKLNRAITSIGDNAFYNCYSLTSISIPNSVTIFENYAFENCFALTSISIPNGVTSIGKSTFSNCTSLTSVVIPNGVTSIGANAFDACYGLNSVTIPSSVTSIGDWAFAFDNNLTDIFFFRRW